MEDEKARALDDGVAMKLGFRSAVGVFARALALVDSALPASLLLFDTTRGLEPKTLNEPKSSIETDADAIDAKPGSSSRGVAGNGKLALLKRLLLDVIPLTGLGDIERCPARRLVVVVVVVALVRSRERSRSRARL